MAAPVSQQSRKYTVGDLVRGVAITAGTTIASTTVDIPLPAGLWRIGLFVDATNIATNSLSTIEFVPITALGVAGTAGEGYINISQANNGATRPITLGSVIYMEAAPSSSIGFANGVLIDGAVQGGSITGGVRLIITKDVNTTGTYGITYIAVRIG